MAVSASGQHIRFLVPGLELQFGEQLKAVGGDAELGAWYLASAPFLSWTDGHNWIHHTSLPAGDHKFKVKSLRQYCLLYVEPSSFLFSSVLQTTKLSFVGYLLTPWVRSAGYCQGWRVSVLGGGCRQVFRGRFPCLYACNHRSVPF